MEQDPTNLLNFGWSVEVAEAAALVESRASCLTVARGRRVAFRPSLLTDEEVKHVGTCRYCGRLLRQLRKEDHPSIEALATWRMPPMDERDAAIIGEHIASCGGCESFGRTEMMAALKQWLRNTGEALVALVPIQAEGVVATPALVGSFGDPAEPFHGEFAGNGLMVRLEEIDGELLLAASTSQLQSTSAHVVIYSQRHAAIEVQIPLTLAGTLKAGGVRIAWPWQRAAEPMNLRVLAIGSSK